MGVAVSTPCPGMALTGDSLEDFKSTGETET